MTKKAVSTIVAVAAVALAATQPTEAFAPGAFVPKSVQSTVTRFSEEPKAAEAVFVPEPAATDDADESGDEDKSFEAAENFGRGAAKVCLR